MSDNLRDLLQKAVGDQRGDRSSGKPDGAAKSDKSSRIVSPEDERGTPYPGDFPNPLDGTYHGCF